MMMRMNVSLIVSIFSLFICIISWSLQSELIQTLQTGGYYHHQPGRYNSTEQQQKPEIGNEPFLQPYFIIWFSYSFLSLGWLLLWFLPWASGRPGGWFHLWLQKSVLNSFTSPGETELSMPGKEAMAYVTLKGLWQRLLASSASRLSLIYDAYLCLVYLVPNYLFYLSLSFTSMAESTAIAGSAVFLSYILALLLGKQAFSRQKIFATLICTLSILILLYNDEDYNSTDGASNFEIENVANHNGTWSSSSIVSGKSYWRQSTKGNLIAFLGALCLALLDLNMTGNPLLVGSVPAHLLVSSSSSSASASGSAATAYSSLSIRTKPTTVTTHESSDLLDDQNLNNNLQHSHSLASEGSGDFDSLMSQRIRSKSSASGQTHHHVLFVPGVQHYDDDDNVRAFLTSRSWPWYLAFAWRSWIGTYTLLFLWIPLPLFHVLSIERFSNFDQLIAALPILGLNGFLTLLHSIFELVGTLVSGTCIFSALCSLGTIPLTMFFDWHHKGITPHLYTLTAFSLLFLALIMFARQEYRDNRYFFQRRLSLLRT